MRAALRGIDVPHWIAVHGVDDVAQGLYRWPDLHTARRAGDLRELLAPVAMDPAAGGEYRSTPGGAPGRPVYMRMVAPREPVAN
jgi:hypothetical protein